ncbi:MAG: ABC transporter ATP-binding protein [Bdellovibrionota bacterium]|nr:MAG: ABC transporter ATP-binding protein [Pseudomonadota bacterium]
MIEVVGLKKTFGNTVALSDITFSVAKGQIVGFLGANGAGKTTTMDILTGCIGADSGTAKVAGFEISESPIEVKRKIGYLPDEPPLHKEMQVIEYLSYAGKLHGLRGDKLNVRVADLIERLELGVNRKRLIGHLSKGFKQRVGLAQALIHDPEVLILDEPTEGLDPHQIHQIREMIRGLKGHHTILFSSHILSEVESVCDRLVIVDKGRVVEQGTHQELAHRLDGGREYQVRVRQGARALASNLETDFVGLSAIRADEAEQTVRFVTKDGDEILDQVARCVLDKGYGLRELAGKSKKLEDVFFQLTR